MKELNLTNCYLYQNDWYCYDKDREKWVKVNIKDINDIEHIPNEVLFQAFKDNLENRGSK
jgi:hypothetical protein